MFRLRLLVLLSLLWLLPCACGGGGGSGGGSSIASLSVLALQGVTLTPSFSPQVFDYTASTSSTVASVLLTANSSRTGAELTLNGQPIAGGSMQLPLVEGANDFEVAVTLSGSPSSAPGTPTTYRIRVTRAPEPRLTDLGLSGGALSPAFDPASTSYSAGVGFLCLYTRVTATASSAGATILLNGVAQASGQAGPPVPLLPGANSLLLRVTTAAGESRDYTIVVTRMLATQFAQEAFVQASSGVATKFGESGLALSGDTLVVGAPRDSTVAFWSGAVYVFRRTGPTTWIQEAFLKASNIGETDEFGRYVAIDGDMLAVGADEEDSSTTGVNSVPNENAPNSGAVYVFRRSGSTWTQDAYIKASNTGAGDRFGAGVALDRDTLAVGASSQDSNAADSGAAYVFERIAGQWTELAMLKASNAGTGDAFGVSLAIDGDTLAVGASREDSSTTGIDPTPNNSAPDSGAVYVFRRSGAGYAQEAFVKASNTGSDDRFGISVALRGDTLAVGADSEDTGGTDAGAAYVFVRLATGWNQEAIVLASNPSASDFFGGTLALGDDVLAVGAIGEDSFPTGVGSSQGSGYNNTGAVYVFTRSGAQWLQQLFVKSNTPGETDVLFGLSLAGDGDTIAVGRQAPTSLGAVYLFR